MLLKAIIRLAKHAGQVYSPSRDELKTYPAASIGPFEAGLAVYALTYVLIWSEVPMAVIRYVRKCVPIVLTHY